MQPRKMQFLHAAIPQNAALTILNNHAQSTTTILHCQLSTANCQRPIVICRLSTASNTALSVDTAQNPRQNSPNTKQPSASRWFEFAWLLTTCATAKPIVRPTPAGRGRRTWCQRPIVNGQLSTANSPLPAVSGQLSTANCHLPAVNGQQYRVERGNSPESNTK